MSKLRIFSSLPNPRVWKATIAALSAGRGCLVIPPCHHGAPVFHLPIHRLLGAGRYGGQAQEKS